MIIIIIIIIKNNIKYLWSFKNVQHGEEKYDRKEFEWNNTFFLVTMTNWRSPRY